MSDSNSKKYYYKDYQQKYYIQNRDKILKKRLEKVICDICKYEVSAGNYLVHTKSQHHKNMVSKIST